MLVGEDSQEKSQFRKSWFDTMMYQISIFDSFVSASEYQYVERWWYVVSSSFPDQLGTTKLTF